MVGFLMVLLALLVGGIVYVLLRFSAEEERRAAAALDTWRERSAQRRVRWEEDEGDDAA